MPPRSKSRTELAARETRRRVKREAALRAAEWWRGICETNNETFLPLFADEHRYLVLMGGGGSGKSIFVGRKVLERCTSEAGHRWLVCRKVAITLRQSCFKQLCEQARTYYAEEIDRIPSGMGGDMYIRFRNGSEIIFAGLDDVEKLKSIYNITGIWVEEASEILESDFNQLDIRMRGESAYYKQMILSFNPISITHWLKRRFFDRKDPRARTHHSTYRDNRFLPQEDRETLEGYKDTDPYYYAVYCLGQWGITGKTVFDGEKLQKQYNARRAPLAIGYFAFEYDGTKMRGIRWINDKNGFIRIYEKPEAGVPYVLGGDTAGEGSDYFVGQLINNVTGRLAATLRHKCDEDQYAMQMVALARFYRDTMIAVEVNFSTFPQKEMERLGHTKFYTREVEDDATHRIRLAYGFRTDRLTRPSAIGQLVAIMREHPEYVHDADTLEEMMSFIRNDAGKAEAAQGAHDDCVMALAIAYYCRMQQSTVKELPKEARVKWRKDMIEDWERADSATRKLMEMEWGKPQF